MRDREREKEKKRKKGKIEEEIKETFFDQKNHKTPKIHGTNCHIMIQKKKPPEGII